MQKGDVAAPKNSRVLSNQGQMFTATQATLSSIYADVREGLNETVGVDCTLVVDERCSVILDLPEGTDTGLIARAIDLENVEAWCDDNGRVHLGISPWHSTKDIDQTVLSAVKVIHVLLGLHASDSDAKPKTFGKKLLTSVAEVLLIQNKLKQRKD